MLHHDRGQFIKILERSSAQTGFPLRLLEKDYYLTIILSQINHELSHDLIFKGGTCLNKIYYSYYRLSEDLDFSLRLPQNETTRALRRKLIQPIKESIRTFANMLDLDVPDLEKSGYSESTQYIFYLWYDSVVLNKKEKIKLEIGLRFNPILPVETKKIKHKFFHPFTGEPLFDGGGVISLALKELIAEKLRAATTRLSIAPRDFYDLHFLLPERFDFTDQEFLNLFKKKLAEDHFPTSLKKYGHNLGRTDKEISDMQSRLEFELFPVLPPKEKERFDIQSMLDNFNKIFKDLE